MRTKKAFKNLVFNLVQQVIGIVTNFILPPMIIGTFGSAMNGLVATIKQIMSYAQLTGAGIASTSTYALYEPLSKNDTEKISGIYNATGKMFNRAGNWFSFIILVVSIIYPFFVSNGIDKIIVTLLVIIIGISGISEFYVIGKYQALLNADQKNFVIAIAQTIGNICNIIMTILLIKLHQTIVIVQLGASVIYVMRILIITWYIKKQYRYLDKNAAPRFDSIKQRNDAVVHELTALVVHSSSTILISIFLGLKAASVYSIYALIFSGLNTICSIVSNAIYASFGEVIAKKDRKVLNSAYNVYEWGYFLIVAIIYTVTFLMIMPFICVYTKGLTDINYQLPLVGALFTVVGFANNLRVPARTLVIASGHFKETRNRSILEMVINLVGQIIFIPIVGIYGALLGAILSFTYRTIDFIIYTNKHILFIDNMRSLKRVLINIIVASFIIIVCMLWFPIVAANYLTWIGYGIIVTVIVSIIYIIVSICFERSVLKESLHIVKNLFKK